MEGHVQSQASPFIGHSTLFTLAANFFRYLLNHTRLKTSFVHEIMESCTEQHLNTAFMTNFPFYTLRLFYKRPTLPKTCVSRTQP